MKSKDTKIKYEVRKLWEEENILSDVVEPMIFDDEDEEIKPVASFSQRVKEMKSNFRILDGHTVKILRRPQLYACAVINPKGSGIARYSPDKTVEPEEYVLHEMLHIALRCLRGISKFTNDSYIKKEEELIQDICRVYKKKQHKER